MKIKELLEELSPIMIDADLFSLKVSLSKRFLLFQLLREINKKIEDDPYLNFLSVLRNYKSLGTILHSTIYELYRDRNKFYFKNFFTEKAHYESVKKDIEWVYSINKDVKVTLTKKGLVLYDNYQKNKFNTLLLTVHSGTWMPKRFEKKHGFSAEKRRKEEDIGIDRIYGHLVLKKGGIWIDNKLSRFAIDFNRQIERAIYTKGSEEWTKEEVWKAPLTRHEHNYLRKCYEEFHFTLNELVNAYLFNIIFDGHSMKPGPKRGEVSFGTKHIPRFYMPIVKSMQAKLKKLGYNTFLNMPYEGGYIVEWLNNRFPNIFLFSIEVNKKLYMKRNRLEIDNIKLEKLSEDMTKIFDVEDEDTKTLS